MSEPDELLAILCTTPCKECRDKADRIRAKWRLIPVDENKAGGTNDDPVAHLNDVFGGALGRVLDGMGAPDLAKRARRE